MPGPIILLLIKIILCFYVCLNAALSSLHWLVMAMIPNYSNAEFWSVACGCQATNALIEWQSKAWNTQYMANKDNVPNS